MLIQYIIKADKASDIEAQARHAIEAGVNWIELCAPEAVSNSELKDVVERLRQPLADKGVMLIVGGRYEAAKEWQADGVHIYTLDRPVSAVRVAMEAWPVIGVNVADSAAAESLRHYDIDYLRFESDGTPGALETVREIARYLDENAIETPLVCGGNVTPANVLSYVDAGTAAVATSNPETLKELIRITAAI